MDSCLYHPLKAGDFYTEGNLFAAPLAGYTDRAFRTICTEMGADLCYTEMVSCEALVRGNKRTEALLEKAPAEKHYAVQLFSGNPVSAGKAAAFVQERYNPLLIDLNCGCPVPKIIKSGAGSDLMRHPRRLGEIVRAIKENCSCPVSVKIRTGWDAQSLNFPGVAEEAVKAGASLLCMHARSRSQGYSGQADWTKLKELKRAVGDIPLLGSGDLFSPEAVKAMLEETGIDGVMLARGVIGYPFLFRETKYYLQTGKKLPPPSGKEKLSTAFRQLTLAVQFRGEEVAVKEMKKQLCAYTRGLPGSSEIRNRLIHAQGMEEYKRIFEDVLSSFRGTGCNQSPAADRKNYP